MAQNFTDDVFDPNHDGQTDLLNIENNFAALKSQFGGLTAPANPVAGMAWVDTTAHILKIRNEANSAWLSIFDLATGKPVGVSTDADTVDGFHASQSAVANYVAVRDASGNLPGNVLGNAATATTATTATTVSAASISQSKLKTATGAVSVTGNGNLTLPGGEYGFYPQVRAVDSSIDSQIAKVATSTSYVTNIFIIVPSNQGHAQQRYIQASPPYDLGDGGIALFIFALVDKNGAVKAMYSAPEAPWHNNGPTSIRPDIYTEDGRRFKRVRKNLSTEMLLQNPRLETHRMQEITQEIKQADMGLIPHPFMGNDLTGLTVVLIDPVSDHTWRAAELFGDDNHFEHHDLYYKNKLTIDNAPLSRKGPPGVQVSGVRWKNSGAGR
ncbi:MAG: hypothetical protein KKH22_12085 [Proteobacteria bacterium]|nr:hypothetical protein [Pseudomonadota bacterium]